MTEPLVWIDCEMTGLDPIRDVLVEVAVVITDSDLTVLDDGLDLLIATDPDKLAGMEDVVRDMHTASGLLEALATATITLEEAEQQVIDYVKRFVPERRKAPLCGNSIATDRAFLSRYMPTLDDHLWTIAVARLLLPPLLMRPASPTLAPKAAPYDTKVTAVLGDVVETDVEVPA